LAAHGAGVQRAGELAVPALHRHGRYDWNWRARQADVKLERLKHKMQLKRRKFR